MVLRSFRVARLIPCVAVVVGCGATPAGEQVGSQAQAVSVCPAGPTVNGIDVSSYQGTVNWDDMKDAGIVFAIARISDGNSLDSDFGTNWTAMKSAGVIRGSYQYFEPADDPTAQAKIVISAVGMLGPGDLPVAADMEATGGQSSATIAANLQTWMTAVQAGTGKAPMIYTAQSYWDTSVNAAAFSATPLWVANYGVSCPNLPSDWSGWLFWQSTGTGSAGGVSPMDLDEFNGTLAQLQAFAGASATDGGSTGTYGATYVSQSWPLATSPLAMTTCETVAASITLQNTGTLPWDGSTRLATTQPRGRASPFADSTWLSAEQAAAVTGTVPPGGTYEFKFNFHAPPDAGSYTEYFGLIEQGVAWFGDPGQAGPPDNDIEATFQVTPGTTTCIADPGVPDGGGSDASDDGGPKAADAGHAPTDGGQKPTDGGVATTDASLATDSGAASEDAAAADGATPAHGPGPQVATAARGCGIAAAPRGSLASLAWGVLVVGVARRRRARARQAR